VRRRRDTGLAAYLDGYRTYFGTEIDIRRKGGRNTSFFLSCIEVVEVFKNLVKCLALY